jgi:transketolase
MKEINKNINHLNLVCKKIRKSILDTSLAAGASSSHFGGSLSTVEILVTLFEKILNFKTNEPLWENRDRFILSKGHACLGYYSMLAEKGFFSKDSLNLFEKNDSFLLGHPVINKKKGIEFSNGSLGMGLSLGIGVALAAKIRNKNFKTYVLIGDGECNEGSVWEAAMSAPHFQLNNLTAILDNNNLQQTGSNKEIMSSSSLEKKWTSFNWHTITVDGHNTDELEKAFNVESNKPKLILAKTIKGKGFKFSEDNNEWHHKVLTKNQYDIAIQELNDS